QKDLVLRQGKEHLKEYLKFKKAFKRTSGENGQKKDDGKNGRGIGGKNGEQNQKTKDHMGRACDLSGFHGRLYRGGQRNL
ncbi:MAG: hypothetical protein NC079_07650, partial [Clostridium sp.]|nr:hypothetical protein [Acetatifactor muris]MCM1527155.1 hypothetical protein [Bacteroides sp.]MCM1563470.1 hypothetical protein [Clostridium sp.]